MGLPLPKYRAIDGVNLLPFLRGETDEAPHPELYWRNTDYGFAARMGDLKLVARNGERPQLYDLSVDLGERNDLASERKEDVSRIVKAYRKWERATVPAKRNRARKGR